MYLQEMENPPVQPTKKKRKKKSDTDSSGKPKNLVCTVCDEKFVGVRFTNALFPCSVNS